MKYRKLRIAWSVAWGVVAVLLCVLWVRSYWWMDEVTYVRSPSKVITAVSLEGSLTLKIAPWDFSGQPKSMVNSYWNPPVIGRDSISVFGFRIVLNSNRKSIRIPDWFAVAVIVAMGALPWLITKVQFRLRTLLLAMTAAGLLLGIMIYLVNR